MKKILTALFLVCLILPVAALPVFGGKPIDVEGRFGYLPTLLDIRYAGPNQFWTSTDTEWWEGDIDGDAETEYVLILHGSDPYADPGQFNSKGVFQGTILGSGEGTAVIKLTGHQKEGVPWYGTWSIKQGTGGLAGVHGQGTWRLELNPDHPTTPFVYEGKVHLKP